MWLLLAAFVAALGYVLWRARTALGLATREAGLSRLEQDSDIPHQPLRALDDSLPGDFKDPATKRLWALHRQRLIDSLGRLAAEPAALGPAAPRPVGTAVRAAAGPAAGAGACAGRDRRRDWAAPSSSAARTAQASLPPMVDLWVTPPAYTRRAPLVSEQTRGVHVAGGGDRQRGPRPGAPSAGGRHGRDRLRRGHDAAQAAGSRQRRRRRWPWTGTRSCRSGMRPGRRSPAGSSTWSRTRCPPSASSASRAPPTAAC